MPGPVKLDRSAASFLATCAECPWWRVVANDPAEAARFGAGHYLRVHEDPKRAQDLLRRNRPRPR